MRRNRGLAGNAISQAYHELRGIDAAALPRVKAGR